MPRSLGVYMKARSVSLRDLESTCQMVSSSIGSTKTQAQYGVQLHDSFAHKGNVCQLGDHVKLGYLRGATLRNV